MADLEVINNSIKSFCNMALDNLKCNINIVLRKTVAKEKIYRRIILKNGEQTIFFKSDERECNNYKYIVYVKSYGKKDYTKRGLIFYIVTPFTLFGKNYYIYYVNNFNSMVVYTQHFFERYVERHLKDNKSFSKDIIGLYLKDTDCIMADYNINHKRYNNCVYSSTLIGTCCGRKVTNNIILYSTFISKDTLEKGEKKIIYDKGKELFNDVFDINGKRIKFLN
jgi:hypothetical protein